MKTSIHLTFDGQCEEAFRFYESIGIGKINLMLKYGESPAGAKTPPEEHDKIVHANLEVGGGALAGADAMPADYQPPRGFYVLLDVDAPTEAERIFGLLAECGTVKMALQETFWAPRFGVVVDRFGIPWEVNCGK